MRFLVFFTAFIAFISSHGQESRVLVRNSPANSETQTSIEVKWYSNEFPYYTEGAHVYRRRTGTVNWEKITNQPISQVVDFDTTQYYQQDQDLGFYTEVVKNTTPEQLEESGFLFVNLLVKSFESRIFSEFVGQFYEDTSVQPGQSYEYRINKISNGRELFLGQSESVTAGPYDLEPMVPGFTVEQSDTTFVLDWEVDPDQFYAVNVYQISDSLGQIRVNENPLMMSETTDSVGNVGYASPKYTIRDITPGKTYTYFVTGKDFFGDETQQSEKITLKLEDTTPPPAPINFEGKADSMKVHLSWDFEYVTDFLELRLYRSQLSDGPFEVVYTTTSEVKYTDSLSLPGPYYYILANTDISGNEGSSRKIFVEVQDVFPPAMPQGLTIEADTGKIFLEWEANTDPDLEGYLVYRTVEKDTRGKYVLLNSDPLKETFLEQPFPKQVKSEFFYYVIAIDTSYNRSLPSAFVSAKLPDVIAPERPFIKHVGPNSAGDEIIITWVANVDADLMGYDLFRMDSLAAEPIKLNTDVLSPEVVAYTDQSMTITGELYYQLVAMDSAGNHSEPSLPFGVTFNLKEDYQEEAFTIKASSAKKGKKVTLRWDDFATDLRGYVLFAGPNATSLKPASGLFQGSSVKLEPKVLTNELVQVRMYKHSGQHVRSNVIKLSKYK